MKFKLLIILTLIFGFAKAQKTPTLIIDGISIKFQGDLSLPYWVDAGKTIAFSVDAISASVLEFNIDSNELQFNQVIHLTTTGTVPTGKAWKVEAIGVGTNNSVMPINGFSTSVAPTIFTSPVTFSAAGSYNWIVPPGVTNICVEVWGGGGNGGFSGQNNGASAGGGGGGYGYQCFSVVPGNSYAVTVGGAGGTSSVGALISATGGGNGGNSPSGIGGVGGSSSASYNLSGTNGVAGGGNGGAGANGGNGGTGSSPACSNGVPGIAPGGGGYFFGNCGSANYVGVGAPGRVIIYW